MAVRRATPSPHPTFTQQRWVTRQAIFINGASWFAGDFDGDGKTDLANVSDEGGLASIDVHHSTGERLHDGALGHPAGRLASDGQWVAGDFDGDGKTDLAQVFSDSGQATIEVHLSTGAGFTRPGGPPGRAASWSAQKWVAGDFDGDGKADVASVFAESNLASIDVHRASGASFVLERWATGVGGFWAPRTGSPAVSCFPSPTRVW